MSTLEIEFNTARQRVLAGEQLTIEEQKRLIAVIRENRFAAAEAGAKARTTRKTTAQAKTGISDEDLLSDLDALGL